MILLEHACKWLIFIPIIESEFDFQRYNIELEDIPSDRFHSHFHILYIFIPIFRSCTFSFSCPVRFHFQVHFHVLFHFHFSEVILWLHTSYLVDTTSELAATHRIINWQIWATLHIYSTSIQHSLLTMQAVLKYFLLVAMCLIAFSCEHKKPADPATSETSMEPFPITAPTNSTPRSDSGMFGNLFCFTPQNSMMSAYGCW